MEKKNATSPLHPIHRTLIVVMLAFLTPSSAGKTSIVGYLAARLGHRCVRINNHEHTDIQEYTGSYAADSNGKLAFREVSFLWVVSQLHVSSSWFAVYSC